MTKKKPEIQEEQTQTYDDFEECLEKDGIEIVIPETDPDDLPEGIGASGFSPRLTAPSYTNPYYIHRDGGGYNLCIKITGNSCLPNCVGYAYGRFLEEAGITSETKLPRCNAEDWLAMAKANGYPTGTTPRLGAVIVWKRGNLWNGNDGCGHVAVVEQINSDGSILVSQSNYGGARFNMSTIKKPYNITGQTFIGFIYNPHMDVSNTVSPSKTTTQVAQEVINGMWGNGSDRQKKLEAAGYSYAAVQAEVNRLLGNMTTTTSAAIKVGDLVTVTKAVNYDNGRTFSLWYKQYKVMQLSGKRAVIGVNGVVTSAINVDYLKKV
ncbi:MAG: CHAP domain-containing protein [Solobacterium sp.]|nr:CHAP domain-containing protein [Solobacterium sp.]